MSFWVFQVGTWRFFYDNFTIIFLVFSTIYLHSYDSHVLRDELEFIHKKEKNNRFALFMFDQQQQQQRFFAFTK